MCGCFQTELQLILSEVQAKGAPYVVFATRCFLLFSAVFFAVVFFPESFRKRKVMGKCPDTYNEDAVSKMECTIRFGPQEYLYLKALTNPATSFFPAVY